MPRFLLPLLSLASRLWGHQGPSSLFPGRTELWTAKRRPWLALIKFSEPKVSRRPWRLLGRCLAAFQPGEKFLRDLPPPAPWSLWLCPSLGGCAGVRYSLLGRGFLPARAPAGSPAAPLVLPPSRSSQTGQGRGHGRGRESRAWGYRAGSPGQGKGGGRDPPRLTERTRERRGCRWWSPPP